MEVKWLAILLTAVLGSNGREVATGGIVAALGTFASLYLGGWDVALKLLIFLMIADYITGVLGAIKSKSMNSDIMFWGGVRKGIVLMVIAIASMCDQWVGSNDPIFRTLALYFYVGREGLSVVENIGIIGVPLPVALTQFLEQLQEKGKKFPGPSGGSTVDQQEDQNDKKK